MIPTFLVIAALVVAGPAPSVSLSGPATVIDGDTIVVQGKHVRLFGIDAPESAQRCGDSQGRPFNCGDLAADVLVEEIGSGDVVCDPLDLDIYRRIVAICTARGRDIAEGLVRRGYAVDYPFYSKGRYAAAEKDAREAKRGLWSGTFQDPRDWRRERRR